MLKPLKINLPEDKIWFTGCCHFRHAPAWHPSLYETRGFKTIQEHDEWLLEQYRKIPHDSVLFILGDFALNTTPEDVESIFAQIPCKKYYIAGNHESQVVKYYKKITQEQFGFSDKEIYPITDPRTNLTFLGSYSEVMINGRFCVLSHFPFAIWNKCHHESWNCHSHNHSSFKESLPDYPYFKRLDCGVDVFKGPVSFRDVKNIMSKKKIKQLDHHSEITS